jgi:hypothetical protein
MSGCLCRNDFGRVKELVGFVPAAEVGDVATRLGQDPGCQVTALAHLAIYGDVSITWDS